MLRFLASSSIAAFLFTSCLTHAGDNVALIIGGSGVSPRESNTIFDKNIEGAAGFLKGSNFDTKVVYYGPKKIPKNVAVTSPEVGVDNSTIEANLQALENRDYKPGSKVMIVIEAHGALQTDKSTDYHCISVTGKECWSPARLEQLRDKLATKGVQLAIMDNSCFSGTTLHLKDANTCVITGSSDNSVTPVDTDKGSDFWLAAEKAKASHTPLSLEAIHTSARENASSLSTSRISTSVDANLIRLQRQLDRLTRLEPRNPDNGGYYKYKPTRTEMEKVPGCIEADFTKQMRNLIQVKNAIQPYGAGPVPSAIEEDLKKLQVSIDNYNQRRAQMEKSLAGVEPMALAKVKIGQIEIPAHLLEVHQALLDNAPKGGADRKEAMILMGVDKNDYPALATLMKLAPNKDRLSDIQQNSKEWQAYRAHLQDIEDSADSLNTAAININSQRNHIYTQAYRSIRSSPNEPCAKFTF